MKNVKEMIKIEDILVAYNTLKDVIRNTSLERDPILSEKYQCNVYLKREDLQVVRSFKIRGVAYTCHKLQIQAKIFMPNTTPSQKVSQVRFFGGDYVEVILQGDTFDSSYGQAVKYCEEFGLTFIHPFDDPMVIAGQGTIGVEILHDTDCTIDYMFMGIGGGGLAAGVGTYIKGISPLTKIVGVEPEGAASMKEAFAKGEVVTLPHIDSFVDGTAVKQVGHLTYEICKRVLDDIVAVPEGKVCTTLLELYNKNAIVAEPSGALSIAALDFYRDEIRGKTVVCIVSGGNNDIDRMQETKERSLIYEGLKHYFIINFPQRPRALREFLDNVLGPHDDITRFEYTKKNNKDNGPALVGIELQQKEDYEPLIRRMEEKGIQYMEINHNPTLFNLLI